MDGGVLEFTAFKNQDRYLMFKSSLTVSVVKAESRFCHGISYQDTDFTESEMRV